MSFSERRHSGRILNMVLIPSVKLSAGGYNECCHGEFVGCESPLPWCRPRLQPPRRTSPEDVCTCVWKLSMRVTVSSPLCESGDPGASSSCDA